MIGYKLTNVIGRSFGGCQWGEGVTHTTDGKGDLCGPGWLHFYEHPLLAVLHDPIHADVGPSAVLWECRVGGAVKWDGQMKAGCTRLTTIRRIPMPRVTREQCVRYGILCAMRVCTDPRWRKWATEWLDGVDRTGAAAEAAAKEVWAAGELAAWAVRAAAEAAARGAAGVPAAWAVRAAAWAAKKAAACSGQTVDLVGIALEATREGGDERDD